MIRLYIDGKDEGLFDQETLFMTLNVISYNPWNELTKDQKKGWKRAGLEEDQHKYYKVRTIKE